MITHKIYNHSKSPFVSSTSSSLLLLIIYLSLLWWLMLTYNNNNNNINHFNKVDAQMYFSCSSAYCTAYGHCPSDFSCRGKNKITFHNVSLCGCCHRCVEQKRAYLSTYLLTIIYYHYACIYLIAEGSECPVDINQNLPGVQCGPHLMCQKSEKYGKCIKSKQ